MLPDVMHALRLHRSRQAEQILRVGETYQRNDFVFATSVGTFFSPDDISKRWRRAVQRVQKQHEDLPYIRLYDTRHTHLTLFLENGENLKIASERAGHSSITQTADTYSHVLPTMQERAVARFGELLKKSSKTG